MPELGDYTIRISPDDIAAIRAPQQFVQSAKDTVNAIPEYNGSNYPASAFIRSCEGAKDLLPINTEKNVLSLLTNRLKHPALSRVIVAQIETIDDLIKFIKRHYQPKKSPDEWLDEFSFFFQKPDEQVSDFSFRIGEHLGNTIDAASKLPANEQEVYKKQATAKAVKYFIFGLRADLRASMRSCTFDEISEAAEKAMEFERIFVREQKIDRNRSANPDNSKSCFITQANETQNQIKTQKYCSNCKMNNHSDSECFKKKKSFNQNQNGFHSNQNTFQNKDSVNSNPNSPGFNRGTFNSNPNAPPFNRNAFNSNGFNSNQNTYNQNQNASNSNGSFNRNFNSYNRPNNSITCNYCKKLGHVINDCRKRAYNMGKKAAEGFENNQASSSQHLIPSGNGQVPQQNGAAAGNSNPIQARQPFTPSRQ